jgi:hypothetical protein
MSGPPKSPGKTLQFSSFFHFEKSIENLPQQKSIFFAEIFWKGLKTLIFVEIAGIMLDIDTIDLCCSLSKKHRARGRSGARSATFSGVLQLFVFVFIFVVSFRILSNFHFN